MDPVVSSAMAAGGAGESSSMSSISSSRPFYERKHPVQYDRRSERGGNTCSAKQQPQIHHSGPPWPGAAFMLDGPSE